MSFIQGKTNTAAASSCTVTLDADVTVGNSIHLVTRSDVGAVWTVRDNLLNNLVQVSTGAATPGVKTVRLHHFINCGAGVRSVTVSISGASTIRLELIEESTVLSFDQTNIGIGTGFNIATGNITTGGANALIICGAAEDGGTGTFTAGAGFTLRQANTDIAVQIEDQYLSSIATLAGTMTISASLGWAAVVASYLTTAPSFIGAGGTSVSAFGRTNAQGGRRYRASHSYNRISGLWLPSRR